jgi:O-antigen/teichoic acid export membrane protein
MIRTAAFVIFPSMIGLSAVSVPLMAVVLGPKWGLCAQILTIISFTYMLSPIHTLNRNLILVKGRSDITLKLSIIQKVLGVILLISAVPFGIFAMFYAGLISSILMLFMNTYYTGKFINVGFWRQMKDITPTFILCTIMFVAVRLVMFAIPNIYIQLVVSILVGAGVYVGLAYLFKFEELGEVWSMYKEMRKQRKK